MKDLPALDRAESKPAINILAPFAVVVSFFGGQFFLWSLDASILVQVAYCLGFLGLVVGGSARNLSLILAYRFYLPLAVALGLLSLYFWIYTQ